MFMFHGGRHGKISCLFSHGDRHGKLSCLFVSMVIVMENYHDRNAFSLLKFVCRCRRCRQHGRRPPGRQAAGCRPPDAGRRMPAAGCRPPAAGRRRTQKGENRITEICWIMLLIMQALHTSHPSPTLMSFGRTPSKNKIKKGVETKGPNCKGTVLLSSHLLGKEQQASKASRATLLN